MNKWINKLVNRRYWKHIVERDFALHDILKRSYFSDQSVSRVSLIIRLSKLSIKKKKENFFSFLLNRNYVLCVCLLVVIVGVCCLVIRPCGCLMFYLHSELLQIKTHQELLKMNTQTQHIVVT